MTRFDLIMIAYLAAATALAVPVGIVISDAVMRTQDVIHQIEHRKAAG